MTPDSDKCMPDVGCGVKGVGFRVEWEIWGEIIEDLVAPDSGKFTSMHHSTPETLLYHRDD